MENTKSYNIFISTGYYNTLMAASLVNQLNLPSAVLIIEHNKQNLSANLELAQQLKVFVKVHHYNIGASVNKLIKLYPNIDNCFLPYYEYRFLPWYNNCQVVDFYDEGISTYCKGKIYSANNLVTNAAYYLISNKFSYDIKNFQLINKKFYLHNLQKIQISKDILLPNSIVFVSNLHIFDEEQQKRNLIIYSKIITLIISKLNLNVYFKSHPRDRFLYNELKALLPENYQSKFYLLTTNNLLIDHVLMNNKENLKFIVGDFTTTLINSYELFDIPAFAIKSKQYSFNHEREISQYFIPDIQELLNMNNPTAEDIRKIYENYNNKITTQIQSGNYSHINNAVIKFLSSYYIRKKHKINFMKKVGQKLFRK